MRRHQQIARRLGLAQCVATPFTVREATAASGIRVRGEDGVPRPVQPSNLEGLPQSRIRVAPLKLTELALLEPLSLAPVQSSLQGAALETGRRAKCSRSLARL